MQAFGHIQSVSGSTDKIEVWVGETGMSLHLSNSNTFPRGPSPFFYAGNKF